MKIVNLSAAAAAMLVFPVVFCSCSTGPEKEKKAEPEVPVKEAKAEPAAIEVKAKPEAKPAAAEKKAAPAPAPEKKAKPAAAEKKAAPAPAPEKKAAKGLNRPVEHVVRTGDNLWKISKKYYGSGAKWKLIYEANRSAIKKQDFLEPGTVLAIPAAQ